MSVFDVMTNFAACLCAQIEEDESPKPCFCGVLPGDSAQGNYVTDCAEDADDCGLAWVRLATGFPSTIVGQQNVDSGNCSKELGLQLEMGIMRCTSIGDETSSPTTEELYAATEQQIKDMLTMRKALICCSAVSTKNIVLGSYLPSGPIGGFLGGVWTFSTNI